MATIYYRIVQHREKYRVLLICEYSEQITEQIKQIADSRWSDTLKAWHMPFTKDFRQEIMNAVEDVALYDYFDAKIKQYNTLSTLKQSHLIAKLNIDFEQDFIELQFCNCLNKHMIEQLRLLRGRWRPETRRWYFSPIEFKVSKLVEMFNNQLVMPAFSRIKTINREALIEMTLAAADDQSDDEHAVLIKKMQEGMRFENLSHRTIDNYCSVAKYFCSQFRGMDIGDLTNDEIRNFILTQLEHRFKSRSYQNHLINALKYLYRFNFRRAFAFDDLPRPRNEKTLPNVLSKEDVRKLFSVVENIKHRTILCLIYSAGLRVSEAIQLKVSDIDSKRMIIVIRQAKGKKDRQVSLSRNILEMLRVYYKMYKPNEYLFEGQNGVTYSTRSVQQILHRALLHSKINKPATVHTLRHSYATHLHEAGTDIRFIQELLGHASSKTTQIYTHVSNRSIEKIQSPFDDFKIQESVALYQIKKR